MFLDVSLWLFAKRAEADGWAEQAGPGFRNAARLPTLALMAKPKRPHPKPDPVDDMLAMGRQR